MNLILGFLGENDLATCEQVADSGNHWAPGRQGTGYERLDIKNERLLYLRVLQTLQEQLGVTHSSKSWDFWDAHLLRYPAGAFIPKHVDDAAMFGMTHHRINVLVRQPAGGGVLIVNEEIVPLRPGDAISFRPDSEPHEVTPCHSERLVLTVGCWK